MLKVSIAVLVMFIIRGWTWSSSHTLFQHSYDCDLTCVSGYANNITQYLKSLLLPLTIYPRVSLCSWQMQSYPLPKILSWILPNLLFVLAQAISIKYWLFDTVSYLCHGQFVRLSVFFSFYWLSCSPLLKRMKKQLSPFLHFLHCPQLSRIFACKSSLTSSKNLTWNFLY